MISNKGREQELKALALILNGPENALLDGLKR